MTSITNELRKYACGYHIYVKQKLLEIADRIDVEHKRQLEVLYRDMSDAEYVKLHKDTGGEYIHEHDKVDWRDHAGMWRENATVVALCNDGCYVIDGTVFHVHKSDIRHHHAPTVEDVLQELVIDWDCATDGEDKTDVLKDYAKRLMLAGDDA